MTTNANDPRPCRAEGRPEALVNRAETSVTERFPCAECASQARRAADADPVANLLRRWANGSVLLVFECDHGTEPHW
jgi:hypothetical protein